LARAILRDKADNVKLAQYSSYYSMVNITAMISAPLLGGYLQHYFGWQSSFIAIIIYNIIALIFGIFTLPETNIHLNSTMLKPTVVKTNLQLLFSNKTFILCGLLLMLAYGCMMAWLTSGPVILQKVVLLTPVEFGWCATLIGFCYFTGAYINSKFVNKFGIQKMLKFGITCLLVAGIIMLIPTIIFHYINAVVFVMPTMIAVLGVSFIIPNSYATGLMPFAKSSGIAVAILGSLQILGGVMSSSIISLASDHNQLPLGIILFVAGLVCMALIKLEL
jgi:predicted MFS family arabinose efflux permease